MNLNHECPLCKKIHEAEAVPQPNRICPECSEDLSENSFIISWIEVVNPETVAYGLGISDYDSEENPDEYLMVLKEITDYLPPHAVHSGNLMGDWEFDCYDVFEADSIDEAKRTARDDYDCEVFAVFNRHMTKLFDDTDLEDFDEPKYHEGDEVFWDDPAEGYSSGVYKVVSYMGGGIYYISNGTSEAEVWEHELS